MKGRICMLLMNTVECTKHMITNKLAETLSLFTIGALAQLHCITAILEGMTSNRKNGNSSPRGHRCPDEIDRTPLQLIKYSCQNANAHY